MNKLCAFLCVGVLLISCKENKPAQSITITEDVEVLRFEQEFYTITPEGLPELKEKAPFLFPKQVADSVWIAKMNNKDEKALFAKSQVVFPDFNAEKAALDLLFSRIKLYNPNFVSPKVITLITDLDYKSNVVYAGDYLFVALDMYLGDSSEVYSDFPLYLKQNYRKEHLVVDVVDKFANLAVPENTRRQFLDKMVYEGKKLYMMDQFLPMVSKEEKMGYTAEQWNWVADNQTNIWSYFVEQKMLYSTDAKLGLRFIANAPFSKFYNQSDKDSPGRVGVWFGAEIVRAYMRNNKTSIKSMLMLNADTILKDSKYKPKK